MSTWDAWFESVWDGLVTKVKSLTEFGENKVFWGVKYPPTVYPSAFVQPTTATSVPRTMRESDWLPIFRIYICVEATDQKTGVLTAWKLAGKIIDQLIADRTLGGTLHNLECGPVMDSPDGLGRGVEQHWVSVDVVCKRKL